ncbi:MAG: gamma carbonic anhydrase family protein, partial [Sandaracinobacteroides sp.]
MTGNSELDLGKAAFVHPSAAIYGKVRMGEGSSIWINAAIRSEAAHVDIGAYTNIQDFVMIHTDPGRPVLIGSHCSITHHATIHGSTIGDNVLVGINATIYGGCHIGDNSIVGQHAYVKDGTIVPPNSIVVGSPAKVIRTANNWVANRMNALFYHRN